MGEKGLGEGKGNVLYHEVSSHTGPGCPLLGVGSSRCWVRGGSRLICCVTLHCFVLPIFPYSPSISSATSPFRCAKQNSQPSLLQGEEQPPLLEWDWQHWTIFLWHQNTSVYSHASFALLVPVPKHAKPHFNKTLGYFHIALSALLVGAPEERTLRKNSVKVVRPFWIKRGLARLQESTGLWEKLPETDDVP